MKSFKEHLEEEKEKSKINTKTVPVYNNHDEWKIMGYVHKSATSIGAAKVAKTPSAFYSMRGPNGHGWVGKK